MNSTSSCKDSPYVFEEETAAIETTAPSQEKRIKTTEDKSPTTPRNSSLWEKIEMEKQRRRAIRANLASYKAVDGVDQQYS